jgi:hypothetical protein
VVLSIGLMMFQPLKWNEGYIPKQYDLIDVWIKVDACSFSLYLLFFVQSKYTITYRASAS